MGGVLIAKSDFLKGGGGAYLRGGLIKIGGRGVLDLLWYNIFYSQSIKKLGSVQTRLPDP